MIIATLRHESDVLRLLVDAGSDPNLQNEVRYTVTVQQVSSLAVHTRRV